MEAYELTHEGDSTTPAKAKKWYQRYRNEFHSELEAEKKKEHAWYTASLGDTSNAHARARSGGRHSDSERAPRVRADETQLDTARL